MKSEESRLEARIDFLLNEIESFGQRRSFGYPEVKRAQRLIAKLNRLRDQLRAIREKRV